MATSTWLPYYVVAGTVFMISSMAFVFARLPMNGGRSLTRFASTLIILTAWLAVAAWLGRLGFYNGAAHKYPTIEIGLGVPILASLALFMTRTGRRLVHDISQRELVSLQFYRVLGGIFLFLWSQGQIPALFAWPAGIGDIIIGLSAPFVARGGNKDAIRLWNILGLVDLVIAVGTGFMTSPSQFQLFAFDHPNLMITAFPLVVVPTFLVPASIVLHILSLRKLAEPDATRTDT